MKPFLTLALACLLALAPSARAGNLFGDITVSHINGGTITGNNSGDQTTITGNAGTSTTLQTSRAINGTAFDGSAPITITAAAGTLTGGTLASGVTASSLTSAAGGSFGTNAFNSTAYLAGNQTITLSGDATGSGTTAITVTIGAGKITNAMLAGSIADANIASAATWNAKAGLGANTFTDTQTAPGMVFSGSYPTKPLLSWDAGGGNMKFLTGGYGTLWVTRGPNTDDAICVIGATLGSGSGHGVEIAGNGVFAFSGIANQAWSPPDVSLTRLGPALLGIGSGVAGNYGGSVNMANLTASGGITFGQSTVGTLPTASSNARQWREVTDADSPVVTSTVASGGFTQCLVRSDGSTWIVIIIL